MKKQKFRIKNKRKWNNFDLDGDNNNNNNNFISFEHSFFSCRMIAVPLLITVIFVLFERGWS